MFKDKKNIFLAIIGIVILAGIIMFCIKGLNYNLSYGKNASISVNMGKDVDKNEVKQLVEETIGSNANVRTLNESNSSILITVKEISDEQKNNLVAKINEKYSLELSQEDLKITNNAQIKLCDLIKPYIAPSIISIALIMIYFVIRYRKFKIGKIILETMGSIVISEAFLFSIYAITRIPVNSLTMPLAVILFVIVIIALIEKYRKEDIKRKEQNKRKKYLSYNIIRKYISNGKSLIRYYYIKGDRMNILKFFNFNRQSQNLSLNEIKEIIRNDENVILIDVRSRQEFLEGHLNGSINIPLYELEQCCERKLIDKNSIIITYCQCGARSKKAIEILKKHGYKNVYHLKDGLDSI